jgi:hypothetical protein
MFKIEVWLKAHYASETNFKKIFRNDKHEFYNVKIMVLKHVRCLTSQENNAEFKSNCQECSKL